MKADLNCESFPENKWLDLMNRKCSFNRNENLQNLNSFSF